MHANTDFFHLGQCLSTFQVYVLEFYTLYFRLIQCLTHKNVGVYKLSSICRCIDLYYKSGLWRFITMQYCCIVYHSIGDGASQWVRCQLGCLNLKKTSHVQCLGIWGMRPSNIRKITILKLWNCALAILTK